MDTVVVALSNVQKESNEQINQALDAITAAMKGDSGVALRIALSIGQRFTEERIAESFPVMCLIDAMIQRVSKQGELRPVLDAFWGIAVPLFGNYYGGPTTLTSRVVRLVKRWATKGVLPSAAFGEELAAAVTRPPAAAEGSEAPVAPVGEGTGIAAEGPAVTVDTGFGGSKWTQTEASTYTAMLQSMLKLIEGLPSHRAAMYKTVVQQEGVLSLTRQSLRKLQGIHMELRNEVARYTSSRDPVKAEAQQRIVASAADDKRSDRVRQLLLSLTSAGDKDIGEHDEIRDGASSRNAPLRYRPLISSDAYQAVSLADRAESTELYKRKLDEYRHPKSEERRRRPFRVTGGGGAGKGIVASRNWFLLPEQWISEKDLAKTAFVRVDESAQGRNTTSIFDVAQKRQRESDGA